MNINTNDLNSILNINRDAKFFIAGDFNSHNTIWNSDKICANGKKIELWYNDNSAQYDMKIVSPSTPTCFRGINGSHIDFAIINNKIKVCNLINYNEIKPVWASSDHASLKYIISTEKIKKSESALIKKSESALIKNYKKTNWKKFNEFTDRKLADLDIPINRNMIEE